MVQNGIGRGRRVVRSVASICIVVVAVVVVGGGGCCCCNGLKRIIVLERLVLYCFEFVDLKCCRLYREEQSQRGMH